MSFPGVSRLLLVLFAASFGALVWAQDKTTLPAEVNETATTKDGVPIQMTYYASVQGKESPVLILLHERDGSRFIWQGDNGFAKMMQNKGYAVITVDLRGHGESRPRGSSLPGGNANQTDTRKSTTGSKKKEPATAKKTGKAAATAEFAKGDYQAMILMDLEAVKKFVFDEHQKQMLNMNKIGIVGVEMSACLAANWAAYDWEKEPHPDGVGNARTPRGQDVRALVLVSPTSNLPGLPISKPLNELRSEPFNIAFYVAVGKGDTKDKGQAKKIFDQLTVLPNAAKRMYFDEFPGTLHGTQLLGKPTIKLEERMGAFFDTHLKTLPSSWIDRRSKLNRSDN